MLDLPIRVHYFHFYGNVRAFYCNIVLPSQEKCVYFIASNNFVKDMGVSGTR